MLRFRLPLAFLCSFAISCSSNNGSGLDQQRDSQFDGSITFQDSAHDIESVDRSNPDIDTRSPTINVKAFGAKGDGVTDDTQAIQEALNQTQGELIIFPDGIYTITDVLYLSSSNKTIDLGNAVIKQIKDGKGWLVIGKKNSEDSFTKTDNIKIIGGESVGAVTAPGDVAAYGIRIQHPNAKADQMENMGCTNIAVNGHKSNGFTGMLVAISATKTTVENCTIGEMIYHPGLGGGGYGVLLGTSWQTAIINNTENGGSQSRHFAYISVLDPEDATHVSENIVISGNVLNRRNLFCPTNAEVAIAVRASKGAAIYDNMIDGGPGGIVLNSENGPIENYKISNNVFKNMHSNPSANVNLRTPVGIVARANPYPVNELIIEKNDIRTETTPIAGMNVNGATSLSIIENSLHSESVTSPYAIKTVSCPGAFVNNNMITGQWQNGIQNEN